MYKIEVNHETGEQRRVPFTEEDLLAISNIAGPTYSELRAAEYPDFREYLDGIVKGDQTQVQAYIDACLAVKAKYPKPE